MTRLSEFAERVATDFGVDPVEVRRTEIIEKASVVGFVPGADEEGSETGCVLLDGPRGGSTYPIPKNTGLTRGDRVTITTFDLRFPNGTILTQAEIAKAPASISTPTSS